MFMTLHLLLPKNPCALVTACAHLSQESKQKIISHFSASLETSFFLAHLQDKWIWGHSPLRPVRTQAHQLTPQIPGLVGDAHAQQHQQQGQQQQQQHPKKRHSRTCTTANVVLPLSYESEPGDLSLGAASNFGSRRTPSRSGRLKRQTVSVHRLLFPLILLCNNELFLASKV
jgi:hypothetical protein